MLERGGGAGRGGEGDTEDYPGVVVWCGWVRDGRWEMGAELLAVRCETMATEARR